MILFRSPRPKGTDGKDGAGRSRSAGVILRDGTPRQLPSWSWFTVANLLTTVLITVADWITPSETVVGMLLVIPIMIASLTDDRREVLLMLGLSIAAFLLAHFFGRGPIFPLWELNRTLAFLSLPAAALVALALQRRRLELQAARCEEARSSDLNRLLMSLLAHDLRSPLVVAYQALDYASADDGHGFDHELLAQARGRLRRSLGTVDSILSLARSDVSAGSAGPGDARAASRLGDDLEEELAAFRPEAEARGKLLEFRIASGLGQVSMGDSLVLRQAAAILVDNAIRHAAAGTIRIIGQVTDAQATLQVEDGGPNIPVARSDAEGAGLGLLLCRTLLERAGGALDVMSVEAGGTRCIVRLPLSAPSSGAGSSPRNDRIPPRLRASERPGSNPSEP